MGWAWVRNSTISQSILSLGPAFQPIENYTMKQLRPTRDRSKLIRYRETFVQGNKITHWALDEEILHLSQVI